MTQILKTLTVCQAGTAYKHEKKVDFYLCVDGRDSFRISAVTLLTAGYESQETYCQDVTVSQKSFYASVEPLADFIYQLFVFGANSPGRYTCERDWQVMREEAHELAVELVEDIMPEIDDDDDDDEYT